MTNYELLYIIANQFTENELPAIKDEVKSLIEKSGGQIGYQEDLGKKKLAYPIGKSLHGYYQLVEFTLEDKSQLKSLNKELNLSKKVLRSTIVIKPKTAKKEKPVRGDKPEIIKAAKTTTTSKETEKTKNLDKKLEEFLQDDNIL